MQGERERERESWQGQGEREEAGNTPLLVPRQQGWEGSEPGEDVVADPALVSALFGQLFLSNYGGQRKRNCRCVCVCV